MTNGRGLGHLPIPDETGTYCVVDGCLRFLNRLNHNEHRRGSGGRRRYGDQTQPTSPQTPIADIMPILARVDAILRSADVIALNERLDAIEAAILGLRAPGRGRVVEDDRLAIDKQLFKMRGDIHALASKIDKLASGPSLPRRHVSHRRIADGGKGGRREVREASA